MHTVNLVSFIISSFLSLSICLFLFYFLCLFIGFFFYIPSYYLSIWPFDIIFLLLLNFLGLSTIFLSILLSFQRSNLFSFPLLTSRGRVNFALEFLLSSLITKIFEDKMWCDHKIAGLGGRVVQPYDCSVVKVWFLGYGHNINHGPCLSRVIQNREIML